MKSELTILSPRWLWEVGIREDEEEGELLVEWIRVECVVVSCVGLQRGVDQQEEGSASREGNDETRLTARSSNFLLERLIGAAFSPKPIQIDS